MKVLAKLRSAEAIEQAVFWSLLAVLCLLYLRPIWAFRYLPVLDLPVHLEMASVIHNLSDPAYAFAKYFELRDGLLPYWGTYGLMHLLSYPLSIDAAAKVVLSLIALGLVGAVLLALRAFGRSRYLVLLALPLIYDVNATYGYLAFRMSVMLCLASLALLRINLDRPRLWREVLLALLGVATFFTHAHGFALLIFLGLFVLALCATRLKATLRSVATAAPALALAAPWYFKSLLGGPPEAKAHMPHLPLIRLAELVPHRLLNSINDNADEGVAVAMLVIWIGLMAASSRPREQGWRQALADYTPAVLTLLMLVAYFAVPNQIVTPNTRIYGINYRFLLVVALLATLVPRIQLQRWRALAMLPALVVAVYYAQVIHTEYGGFNQRTNGFDRVVAGMQPGKRVVAFTYNTRDPRFTVPMLGHFVGYYHARKGGGPSSSHTFATYRYMPVKLRDIRMHPEPNYHGPQNWPLLAAHYDYFMVCDHPGSRRSPFPLQELKLVAEGGPWRVYEKLRR